MNKNKRPETRYLNLKPNEIEMILDLNYDGNYLDELWESSRSESHYAHRLLRDAKESAELVNDEYLTSI